MGSVSTRRTPSATVRIGIRFVWSIARRGVPTIAAGGLFAFGVVFAWLAFTMPLEVEAREGSVWIHVLAKRAGVDIYDPAQVAFVNMNHGPLDPILKTWVSMALPTLPGHMVTRCFVLITPLVFLWTAYVMTRKSVPGALIAASGLYLLCLHVSRMTLAGRTDVTALCAAAICGVLIHRLLVSKSRNWSSRSYVSKQVGLGAASAALVLVSWRYFPVPLALQFVVLTKQLAEPRRALPFGTSRFRRAFAWCKTTLERTSLSGACFSLGFAAVWLPIFYIELGGDGASFYRHFFGFFSKDSGWGLTPGAEFQLLPRALWEPRLGAVLVFAGLILLGLYRLRRRPVEAIAWLVMLAGLWVTVCYGFFKNQGGGGLYYFFEFFVFAWIFVIHAVCQRRRRGARAEVGLLALTIAAVPWDDLSAHYRTISDIRQRALAFRAEVAQRSLGETVFGEDTHLFKDQYRGEVVDTGDVVNRVVQNGYFGEEFSDTYREYTKHLRENPPPFVLVALLNQAEETGIMTPTLQSLLRLRYIRVATMSDNCFAWGGSQALYELKGRPPSRQEP